jgi:hypothetical protein
MKTERPAGLTIDEGLQQFRFVAKDHAKRIVAIDRPLTGANGWSKFVSEFSSFAKLSDTDVTHNVVSALDQLDSYDSKISSWEKAAEMYADVKNSGASAKSISAAKEKQIPAPPPYPETNQFPYPEQPKGGIPGIAIAGLIGGALLLFLGMKGK